MWNIKHLIKTILTLSIHVNHVVVARRWRWQQSLDKWKIIEFECTFDQFIAWERFHFPLDIRFECDGGRRAECAEWKLDLWLAERLWNVFLDVKNHHYITYFNVESYTWYLSLPRCISPNKKVKLLLENNSFHIGLLIFHGSLMPGESCIRYDFALLTVTRTCIWN